MPGDVIAGGTSAGTAADKCAAARTAKGPRFISQDGDTVEVSSSQIGELSTRSSRAMNPTRQAAVQLSTVTDVHTVFRPEVSAFDGLTESSDERLERLNLASYEGCHSRRSPTGRNSMS